jgi:hypothetical protein
LKNKEIVKSLLEKKAVIDTEVLDNNTWSPINIGILFKTFLLVFILLMSLFSSNE